VRFNCTAFNKSIVPFGLESSREQFEFLVWIQNEQYKRKTFMRNVDVAQISPVFYAANVLMLHGRYSRPILFGAAEKSNVRRAYLRRYVTYHNNTHFAFHSTRAWRSKSYNIAFSKSSCLDHGLASSSTNPP
jgi:hypothetical protein